jgi:hypothetical protein
LIGGAKASITRFGICKERREIATDYAVVKIKGLEPEKFVVVGIDWGAGQIKSMTREISEKDMREYLNYAPPRLGPPEL